MKRPAFRRTLCCVAVATLAAASCPKSQGSNGALAITHVVLFDGTGAPPARDMTVVISGERVVSVGPSAVTAVPAAARVVDGSGEFLIPGLWDMHTHVVLAGDDALALLVANGVTGVRDMGGDAATLRRWRSEIAAGSRVGPELVFTSPVLESATWLRRILQIHLPGFEFPNPDQMLNPHLGVALADDAESAVDSVLAAGSAFVKFRTIESRAAYFAIARASRTKGVAFVGHSPTPSVTWAEASDSGQKSIEHTDFRSHLDGLDQSARSGLYAKLATNGTWLTPTLVSGIVSTASTDVLGARLAEEVSTGRRSAVDGLHYLNHRMLESFRRDLFIQRASAEGDSASRQQQWTGTIRHLREMHLAGVPMLTGTDLGALWVFPGASLHDELSMFVHDVGFTPREVLETATRKAATFVGEGPQAGTIEPGKRADCVLLSADPLASIENTRQIAAVVARGRLLERHDLDTLLAAVRARARGRTTGRG
ncbi:MAG TPA: amidohydrolase family protein [Gemmatimonadaceae bacterium]|nr:amidohydrolase family protein [Gemmatimonadaceae bacterium]